MTPKDSTSANTRRTELQNTVPSHVIRLYGPWKTEAVGPLSDRVPERFQAPTVWKEISPVPFSVLCNISRRFGLPTGITDEQRLELVIVSPGVRCVAFLNGVEIGEVTPTEDETRFDVTGKIEPRNELKLVFQNTALPDGASPLHDAPHRLGDVRLEILG